MQEFDCRPTFLNGSHKQSIFIYKLHPSYRIYTKWKHYKTAEQSINQPNVVAVFNSACKLEGYEYYNYLALQWLVGNTS